MVFPKALGYMLANKGELKILDLKSKDAGVVTVEIEPCNAAGKPLTEKDSVMVRDPKTDLVNKNISFNLKIGASKIANTIYEDIYCQFQFNNDPQVFKTEIIRGTSTPDFKYNKQFTYQATPQVKYS